jgi:hypothetical protein
MSLCPEDLPEQEALTSPEAFKFARECIGMMHVASDVHELAQSNVDQRDAQETYDTASDTVLGLLLMLEKRGVLADVQGYLNTVYGGA